MKFTIPIQPITKKNSQRLVNVKGRIIPLPSKAYKQYESDCGEWFGIMFANVRPQINKPVNVKAIYYMGTRRRVDLINLHEALHDILVKYGVIEDDNSKIIVSTDGSRVDYDKQNPRTEIEITYVGRGMSDENSI